MQQQARGWKPPPQRRQRQPQLVAWSRARSTAINKQMARATSASSTSAPALALAPVPEPQASSPQTTQPAPPQVGPALDRFLCVNNYEQYAPLLLEAGCTRMRELCSLNVAACVPVGCPLPWPILFLRSARSSLWGRSALLPQVTALLQKGRQHWQHMHVIVWQSSLWVRSALIAQVPALLRKGRHHPQQMQVILCRCVRIA